MNKKHSFVNRLFASVIYVSFNVIVLINEANFKSTLLDAKEKHVSEEKSYLCIKCNHYYHENANLNNKGILVISYLEY